MISSSKTANIILKEKSCNCFKLEVFKRKMIVDLEALVIVYELFEYQFRKLGYDKLQVIM